MRQAKTIQRINTAQKALLHIAADEIGIDRDTYEDILDQYGGVRSSVDLTPAAFKRVMKHLEGLGFERRPKAPQVNSTTRRDQYEHYRARWASLGHRPGMATPDQLARIECDWDELRWWWQGEDKKGSREKALRGLLFKRFHRSELRMLETRDAFKVIEALKNIAARKQKGKGK